MLEGNRVNSGDDLIPDEPGTDDKIVSVDWLSLIRRAGPVRPELWGSNWNRV